MVAEVVWGGSEYPAFDLRGYDGYDINSFSAIFFIEISVKHLRLLVTHTMMVTHY